MVPGDDIPYRRPNEGGARFERVRMRCSQGDTPSFFGSAPRAVGAADQEQVLALGVRQQKRVSDPVEDVRRRSAAATLLEPGIPRQADMRALCDLLAAEARRAAPLLRKAAQRGIELCPEPFQISPECNLMRSDMPILVVVLPDKVPTLSK